MKRLLIILFLIVPSICFSTEMCITMPKVSSYPFSERVYHLNREPTEAELMVLEKLDGVDKMFFHHGRYSLEIRKGLLFHWMIIDRNIMALFGADSIDFCPGFAEGVYINNRNDGYSTWAIK